MAIVRKYLQIYATIDIAGVCVGHGERSTDPDRFKPNLDPAKKNLPDFSTPP
jgi:hypothetical protein